MARRKGSKDTTPRTRSKATPEALKKIREKRDATLKEKRRRARAEGYSKLFGGDNKESSNVSNESNERSDVKTFANQSMLYESDINTPSENESDNIATFNYCQPTSLWPHDITANLDIDDYDAYDETNYSDDYEVETSPDKRSQNKDKIPTGVQQKFVWAVQKRIQFELSTECKAFEMKWLLTHLKKNNWWIRRDSAEEFARRLGITVEYTAYYRDVYVWLPDLRWGDSMKPCCPNCKTNKDVSSWGFHHNHFGRVVVGLSSTYYVLTRVYKCFKCENNNKRRVEEAQKLMEQQRVNAQIKVLKSKYTFMGWNAESLPLFPHGRGNEFPAYLTWRAGLDKSIINLMRPLFDKGFKAESLSELLLEMHSKEYTMQSLRHENEIAATLSSSAAKTKRTHLSDFGDKEKYRGLVPSGNYLRCVYKSYHRSIRPHMIKEVMKRGARTLHWDVSYKEAKNLYKYCGNPVFRGLVTATNEYGEVRLQFHVYTDSHDQMITAIEAFKDTTKQYGLPGVELFFTDNPSSDKDFFMSMLPSLRDQQRILDDGVQKTIPEHPKYEMDSAKIRVVAEPSEINTLITAIKEDMAQPVIGLDCEWNVNLSRRGLRTHQSKIGTIQCAYFDSSNVIRVLVIKTLALPTLPDRLVSLLGDQSVKIAGVNVGGDLNKISRDFPVKDDPIQKRRKTNVFNLGVYARQRDVVQNGSVGLAELSKKVLKTIIEKGDTIRFSDWNSQELSDEQIKYAAQDAAVSLQIFDELQKMPDLTRRLKIDEVQPGKRVDLVPRSGSLSCMATRAATGVIVECNISLSPKGLLPERVKVGKNSVAIEIETIYSESIIVPGYKNATSSTPATLTQVGLQEIVVPVSMLREHVPSQLIRPTPEEHTASGMSQPCNAAKDVCTNKDGSDNNCSISKSSCEEVENDDSDDESTYDEIHFKEYIDESSEYTIRDLTIEDVELIRKAAFESEDAINGQTILKSNYLTDAPAPEDIHDKFSSVLGDVYHAMDRAKIPIRHEAKKSYYVSLMEAFLTWNPDTLEQLKNEMRKDGLSEEEIKTKQYFKPDLFLGCVDRRALPPRLLYWRVRAVFVFFGNLKDSKTKAPLFNKAAWKKADNLLKEILNGYYSDPPGVQMYNKKLKGDGTVMKNKYGMDIIECMRGTNRTECYHKNLVVTFGGWHAGIEMSDALLGERRHRHNHKTSEKRRLDFPKIGHYDTWLIDQLQNLVFSNHGILLYPGWSNTSDYKLTEESFDTVPLQQKTLHDALEQNSNIRGDIKLTRDQKYLADAMGTKLPFLPFTTVDERKQFAKYVLQKGPMINDDAAAIDWCEFVDGIRILPKLPVHIRNYFANWDRNQRTKDLVRKAENGIAIIKELNSALSPQKNSYCDHNDVNVADINDGVSSSTEKEANHMWKEVPLPQPFPEPNPEALHNFSHVIVGGSCVGNLPNSNETNTKKPRKRKECGRCRKFEGVFGEFCKGRGKLQLCQYFEEDGATKDNTTEPRPTAKSIHNALAHSSEISPPHSLYYSKKLQQQPPPYLPLNPYANHWRQLQYPVRQQITFPPPWQVPPIRAIVGSINSGCNTKESPKKKKVKSLSYVRRCGRCEMFGGEFGDICPGRGYTGKKNCKYFNENGTMK